ncbi:MAG TPA: hypothetical protein VND45_09725 [Thermoanaerobaculia bacterium]|jgi:hypothetical protein|nr:hypothetical protein [Thermoanaerobaculia bacterium]
MLMFYSMAGVMVAALLTWTLLQRQREGRLGAFNERRRNTSQLVGRGELVDGNRHMSVALALTDSTFFYENSDLAASLDLDRIREVEYDTELVTGHTVTDGRVLRLRSSSQTFEFVLPQEMVTRWHTMLPPRGLRQAVAR